MRTDEEKGRCKEPIDKLQGHTIVQTVPAVKAIYPQSIHLIEEAVRLGEGQGSIPYPAAFGKAMAGNDPGVTIGLVPCAFGGTPLKRWERGGDLYSNAVHHANLAMREGTLKGILWHQGESDAGMAANANSYGYRLARMIQDIRADLGSPDLPFVVGQIGEFLYDRGPDHSPYARVVNAALAGLPGKVPATACAFSKDLKHKGDVLHFDAASQREFGRRYAAEMMRLRSAQPKPDARP